MDIRPDVSTVFAHAVEDFRAKVAAVPQDRWDCPTPCAEWDVRALVNHVVGEQRWVVPLLAGKRIADVGDTLDGDLLGAAPAESSDQAAKAAVEAYAEPGATGRIVHLSFGDTPATDYAWQLVADHVVHGWDLAVAAGLDPHLDPDLVVRVEHWWGQWEEMYRSAGVVGERHPLPEHASRQDRLLCAFGRDPSWSAAAATVARFGAAWEAWDLDRIVGCLAEDAVFESTDPAPEGRRVVGRDAIRAEWSSMFEQTRAATFEVEESVVCGDRATVRWRFGWAGADGSTGHVRGIDLLRVERARVTEKLSYVKG